MLRLGKGVGLEAGVGLDTVGGDAPPMGGDNVGIGCIAMFPRRVDLSGTGGGVSESIGGIGFFSAARTS